MSLLLLFGQAAAVTYSKTGAVVAGTKLSGADVFEAAETGAAATDTTLSGVDAYTATETGAVAAGTRLSGSAQAGFVSKLGTVAAGAASSGADVFIGSRTGAVVAATWGSGGDASTVTRVGTVKTTARLSGFTRGLPGLTGKFVLMNARVTVAGIDVSQLVHAVGVKLEREEIDVTPFDSRYRVYTEGPTTGTFTISMFYDPSLFTPGFWASLDSPVPVEVTPQNLPVAPENPTWTAIAVAVRRTQLTGDVGEPAEAGLELQAQTEVTHIEF